MAKPNPVVGILALLDNVTAKLESRRQRGLGPQGLQRRELGRRNPLFHSGRTSKGSESCEPAIPLKHQVIGPLRRHDWNLDGT